MAEKFRDFRETGLRMVTHLDINPAQQGLTSVINWEPVFSLGQAILPQVLLTTHSYYVQNYVIYKKQIPPSSSSSLA